MSDPSFLLLSHGNGDIVTDSAIHSVHPEAAQKQKFLESCQTFLVLHGEWSLLWGVQVIPLKQSWGNVLTVKSPASMTNMSVCVINIKHTSIHSVGFFSMSPISEPNSFWKSSLKRTISSQPCSGNQSHGFFLLLFSSDRFPDDTEGMDY